MMTMTRAKTKTKTAMMSRASLKQEGLAVAFGAFLRSSKFGQGDEEKTTLSLSLFLCLAILTETAADFSRSWSEADNNNNAVP